MLIVLIIISIILLFVFYWIDEELIFIPAIGLVIKVVALLICVGAIVDGRIINNKIKLYEEQNKEIEQKIEITVKQYMEYENKTYSDLKTENYMQLVNLYPDLKSNELIKNQINVYTNNNKNITNLKEKRLNISNYKWWVYFGK